MKAKKTAARKKTVATVRTRTAARRAPAAKKKAVSRARKTTPRAAASPTTTRAASRTRKKPASPTSTKSPTSIPAEAPKPVRRRVAAKRAAGSPEVSAEIARPVARRKQARPAPAAPAPVKLPAILLEGDQAGAPLVSGPGEKFALGPTPPVQHFAGGAHLPEAYGTKRLFVIARDPRWLYAYWDLTRDQQRQFNKLSADGHLIVRVRAVIDSPETKPLEIHVHPESRHWFIHVERAATKYCAELGYYTAARQWNGIASSGATLTPPETMADAGPVEFSTLPVDVPFEELLAVVKGAIRTQLPLARAIEELRREGHRDLPAVLKADGRSPVRSTAWTPAQERALAEVLTLDEVRRVWIGSLEVTELVRRELRREEEVSSISAAQLARAESPEAGAPAGEAAGGISSPAGGEQPSHRGFWFNINAELIIYGATERDASVTIGGRKVTLRHDGSFSYRFALPDGRYELPVVAVSADHTDGRAAELSFTRATKISGDVGAHPQDPALNAPHPENV